MPIRDIQRAIGQEALNRLFDECFLTYPDQPESGAKAIVTMLHQRYGTRLSQSKTRD
jgi:hypothetical protein